jgi:hypothetical protein
MSEDKGTKAVEKETENAVAQASGKKDSTTAEILKNAPKRNLTFADNAFEGINSIGVNFLANSSLSLGITYNLMPTKAGEKLISGLGKAIEPVVSGWGKLKNTIGMSGKQISEATRKLNIRESARSSAEILIMCIAGTLILIPMKWLQDHKKSIVDKIDRWKNPEYHKYIKEKGVEPELLPCEEDDKKQGWGELLSARAVGIASVLGIDAVMQNFNNSRVAQNKGNFDTAEWKLGSWIYDKLPKPVTEKFVNFFSARKNSDLSGIQVPILERLRKTVGGDAKKMIFAEQTRFLSKELSLTAVLSAIMYVIAKTGAASSILGKLGMKEEKKQQKVIDDIVPDLPLVPITKGKVDLDGDGLVDSGTKKKYADKIEPLSKKAAKPEKQEGYVGRYLNENPSTLQASV